MQTKKVVRQGRVRYLKPTKNEGGYKPLRRNRNLWYFHDRETLICRQVWEIGQDYLRRMQEPKGRPRHRIQNPVQLTKLFFWLFLTGARQQEAFLSPCTLDIINNTQDGGTYVTITHRNQKHKEHKGDTVTQVMPIFDEWEQKMWTFITDGNRESEPGKIFGYENWKSTKKSNITALFKTNFRTTLETPDKKVHRDAGIAPHILRHMRTFNVLHNHHVPDDLAQVWFGWDTKYMIDYYAHIRAVMSTRNQLGMLSRAGLLTGLRIEATLSQTHHAP